MTTHGARAGQGTSGPDYRTLPPGVRLEETIATVDADPVTDPDEVRNLDQHAALRDD